MKYVLFIVGMIAFTSCTLDLKKFQTPENAAMSPGAIALYKDTADIAKDNYILLKPGTTVYFTDETATVNQVHYTRVAWGDSTGYTQTNMVMPRGRWAVITAPNHGIVELFGNAELDEVVDAINNDWELMVVGEAINNSVPVFYYNSETGKTALYVPSDFVHEDSLDVAFYRAYTNGQRSDNPDFQKLDLYSWRMASASNVGGDDEDFNDTDYGDPGGFDEAVLVAKEYNWSIGDNPIPEDQYPGVIKKYLVLEDDTELDATDLTIEGKYAYKEGTQEELGNGKSVKAVRFEVTLNRPMDLRFEAESFYASDSPYNTQFTKIFNGAEANKPYSVVIGETAENTMVLCSILRVTIFAGDVTAAATVSGSCGD